MIALLEGAMAGRTAEGCFIDVRGVGYRLTCSTATLRALPPQGQPVRLWTHLHVREDELALFGFATEGEQRTFEACLEVAGVGPKVALQLCSAFSPESFRRALVREDVDALAGVPGIGKKTAQRIVLELKDKVSAPDLGFAPSGPDVLATARAALQNLGYSPGEVRAALSEFDSGGEQALEELVRSALRRLAS